MSRMLRTFTVLSVWSGVVFSGPHWVLAQAPEGNAQVRQPRPQNNAALQVQNLPPALERLLSEWSENSAKIQKLQGAHHRYVYDTVFGTEKRAEGVFYYEAPGKGRIDLRPKEIGKDEVSKKMHNGQPFKLYAERPERWICDGTEIWQVNDQLKQVDIFPIPKENQGQNIMDGPMPFLFGMPPAKAKMRYELTLLTEDAKVAVIEVLPRLQMDAANWKKATVILDKTIYLPQAVKLINPAGTNETVYTFGQFAINKPKAPWILAWFGDDPDPFRPKLKGFAFKMHTPPADEGQDAGPTVPSLAGQKWDNAQKLLKGLGCEVQFQVGEKAPEGKLNYVVYQQDPAAKTPLQKGLKVTLTIYDVGPVPNTIGLHSKAAGQKLEEAGYKVKYLPGKAATDTKQCCVVYQQSPAAGQESKYGAEITLAIYDVGPVPNTVGLPWKDAGQLLEQAGYKVKYLPGKATTDEKQLYVVYQQSATPGQKGEFGAEVTLTVYNKPQTAAN